MGMGRNQSRTHLARIYGIAFAFHATFGIAFGVQYLSKAQSFLQQPRQNSLSRFPCYP